MKKSSKATTRRSAAATIGVEMARSFEGYHHRLISAARKLRGLSSIEEALKLLLNRIRRAMRWRRKRRLDKSNEAILRALRAATCNARRSAAKHGMPLNDSTLCRYLQAAGWSLDFPDRSVAAAIADTVAWRERTPAARSPAPPDNAVVRVTPLVTTRGERLVALRPVKRSAKWWSDSLVAAVELACRESNYVCVVIYCGDSSGADLLDAAKHAAPTFPIFSMHYPGRLGRVVVLDAKPASRACWWFIKNLIDVHTRNKICFIPDIHALKQLTGVDLPSPSFLFHE